MLVLGKPQRVMAFAAEERRSQLGVLRVLGFCRGAGIQFVLEVLGIILSGALAGIALGELALHYLPVWLQGSFLRVMPAPWAYQLLPLWLGVLALITFLQAVLGRLACATPGLPERMRWSQPDMRLPHCESAPGSIYAFCMLVLAAC